MDKINTFLPIVSICCQTYNHKDFISQAIESFLIQKTSFHFEILLRDDASTDGTAVICKEYAEKHPNIINLLAYDENQYQKGVSPFRDNVKRARGKYIAICEGDDYWTDPYKLQKQVDFLEANPDVVMTFGNALINDSTNQYHRKGKYVNADSPKLFTPDAIFGLGLPTLTMVFRSGHTNFSDNKIMSGDMFLRLELSLFGNFYYHADVFGVHRKHPTGISRTNNRLKWNLNTAENLKNFKKKALKSQQKIIDITIAKHFIHAFIWSLLLRKHSLSVSIFFNLIFSRGFYTRFGLGTLRMLFVKVLLKKDSSVLDIF